MKRAIRAVFQLLLSISMLAAIPQSFAGELPDHSYVNYSSDRSTWFFRTDGGNRDIVFSDFFYPFDPTVKTRSYDPLTMFRLQHRYHFNGDGALMIHLGELKKLYDPYFDFDIDNNNLSIRHTLFNKLITDGFGDRRTTLEYTKMVWDLSIDIDPASAGNSGTLSYTEFEPTTDGASSPVNDSRSSSAITFVFAQGRVEMVNGQPYVPVAALMQLMGKRIVEDAGYLAVQGENMPDVTLEVLRDNLPTNEDGQPVTVPPVRLPLASNIWRCGSVEDCDEDYSWADYMNDVADGERDSGWLWRGFHIPSGASSKDVNGQAITVEADRILPYSIYVPSDYSHRKSRMAVMLHGATGNENTTCDRLVDRDIYADRIAEDYNYVVVSPNGWIREPQWREGQALYSFEQSFALAMDEFPVSEDKVFLTGNSFGGKGTFELAMRFPDRFRAMAPTAAKIGERGSYLYTEQGVRMYEEWINFEETDYQLGDIWAYDLADIADMSTMLVQGTGDTTTSYYFQLGNSLRDGPLVRGVFPKLTDATYLVVEKGHHSYAYGAALEPIFDFFEDQLGRCADTELAGPLYLIESKRGATLARLGSIEKEHRGSHRHHRKCESRKRYTRKVSTELVGNTVMIAIDDLARIYGPAFKAYPLSAYAIDPAATVNYWSLILGNHTLNLVVGETRYRKNMERYKTDVLSVARLQDQDFLDDAPEFTVAPFVREDKVYVPLLEVLEALQQQVVMVDADYPGHEHEDDD